MPSPSDERVMEALLEEIEGLSMRQYFKLVAGKNPRDLKVEPTSDTLVIEAPEYELAAKAYVSGVRQYLNGDSGSPGVLRKRGRQPGMRRAERASVKFLRVVLLMDGKDKATAEWTLRWFRHTESPFGEERVMNTTLERRANGTWGGVIDIQSLLWKALPREN